MASRGGLKNSIAVLASALACASCVRQVQTSAPRAPSRSAVSVVMARQVQNAVDAGDGDPEARELRKRLAANANDLDARILLARLYSRKGLPDLALEHYRLAEALFPDSVVVTLALAKALRDAGETGEALKAVEAGVAKHPEGSWELLSLEAILEDDQRRFADAEVVHREALALAPGRSALLNNLGYNLLLQGQFEAAAAEFRQAVEVDPRSGIARNNLGIALASESRSVPGQALSEWQRSAGAAVAHNNLAAVLIEQGRYEEARAELLVALRLRRDFPEALANMKLVSERDGQSATVPVDSQPVNLWKRIASTLAKITGARTASNTPASGGAKAGPVSASVTPVISAPPAGSDDEERGKGDQ
jgi:Flp pilus assembly protein TadD